MNDRPTVVLDTNILLVIISRRSPYHHVFQSLLAGEYRLAVTTEVLEEYAEILERYVSPDFSHVAISLLLDLPNIVLVTRYFSWNLIHHGPDDNKFVDCAIAANAHMLVSEDKHFQVLTEVDFPKVHLVSLETFSDWLTSS
ncbi:MAG: PIN domain-containing protein [Bacteroidota bacterium]